MKSPGSALPGHHPFRLSSQVPCCLGPMGLSLQSSRHCVTLTAGTPLMLNLYTAWQYSPHCSLVAAHPCPVTVSCMTALSPSARAGSAKSREKRCPLETCDTMHTVPSSVPLTSWEVSSSKTEEAVGPTCRRAIAGTQSNVPFCCLMNHGPLRYCSTSVERDTPCTERSCSPNRMVSFTIVRSSSSASLRFRRSRLGNPSMCPKQG
mmetsp:Transcript_2979/g.7612  ORF Transcript_2979/g.7612 Transcript_2979/m.7612 type:complete len:206 (-) Transcript_2979:1126-1743(-)